MFKYEKVKRLSFLKLVVYSVKEGSQSEDSLLKRISLVSIEHLEWQIIIYQRYLILLDKLSLYLIAKSINIQVNCIFSKITAIRILCEVIIFNSNIININPNVIQKEFFIKGLKLQSLFKKPKILDHYSFSIASIPLSSFYELTFSDSLKINNCKAIYKLVDEKRG